MTFRKSEYPRVPTSGLGYAIATLVGGAIAVVTWFFLAFFGLASGCLSFLDTPRRTLAGFIGTAESS